MTLNCPSCGEALALIKPSAANGNGRRYAGAWCERCCLAWRAYLPALDEGWRFVYDIGTGERQYVLNGHVSG